jgi:hypothetical protein
MALIVPLIPAPVQTTSLLLNGARVKLNVYYKYTGLFIDVFINDAPLLYGILCQYNNPIIRDTYLGFPGELVWIDTFGTQADPTYQGIGGQFCLAFFYPGEYGNGG